MTAKSKTYIEYALKAGLSAKAAAVYITLLESGMPLSPKTIILKTGLHRQYVYDALHELIDKDLLTNTGKERTIKYSAGSPHKLMQEIEKNRIDSLEGLQVLTQLYDHSPAGTVEVIRGRRAVIESEFKILEEASDGDYLDIVGGAGMRWVDLFDERIEEWEKLRKEKNVKLRYIGSGEDVRHNKEESIIENESRTLPDIGDIVNVAIRPGSVSFNIYVPEILTVRVRNIEAAKSQRALFEVLWSVAK